MAMASPMEARKRSQFRVTSSAFILEEDRQEHKSFGCMQRARAHPAHPRRFSKEWRGARPAARASAPTCGSAARFVCGRGGRVRGTAVGIPSGRTGASAQPSVGPAVPPCPRPSNSRMSLGPCATQSDRSGDPPAATASPQASTPMWSRSTARVWGFCNFGNCGMPVKPPCAESVPGAGVSPWFGGEPESGRTEFSTRLATGGREQENGAPGVIGTPDLLVHSQSFTVPRNSPTLTDRLF